MTNASIPQTLWLLALLGWCAPTASAHAQDDAQAALSARTLFEEGIALADQRDWAAAEERFRRALSLRKSPVIAFNLASILHQRGEHAEAARLAQGVTDDPNAPDQLRQNARELLADLESSVATLTVRTQGGAETYHVTLDHQELPASELGIPRFLEPGPHVVAAHADDRVIDQEQVTLSAGQDHEVMLDLHVAPTPEQVATLAAAESNGSELTRADSEPAVTETWWFWTGVGAATVGAVVVGVLLASSADGSGGGPEPGRFSGDFVPGSLAVEVAR